MVWLAGFQCLDIRFHDQRQETCAQGPMRGVQHASQRAGKPMHSTQGGVCQRQAAEETCQRHVCTSFFIRAIFEGAIEAGKALHDRVIPEIMVPLVATKAELDLVKGRIAAVAREVEKERRTTVAYSVGTMVELPRACLMAGEIGQSADFFSFGTNDLTQTTFGLSRDDAGRFLGEYVDKAIIQHDPFVTLDKAVGELMQIGVERGRKSRPDLKIGICGEHGGDPETIGFCERIGLNYVSCSPYRVPVARLAAAQAALGVKVPAVTDP